MYVFAFILGIATGLFYMAGHDGLWANPLCIYGGSFCDHPEWLGAATILALLWGLFVKV